MKVIIHRGTHQIGGCITEIQSEKGTKIAIDIGENLPTMDGKEKIEVEVEGLNKGKASFDAVFVTHYHGDHIGLYNKILPQIPIYIGEDSNQIYKILIYYLYHILLLFSIVFQFFITFFLYHFLFHRKSPLNRGSFRSYTSASIVEIAEKKTNFSF